MPFAASMSASSPASFRSRSPSTRSDRRPPLPARARLEQPLKVAVQQMRRLEPDDLRIRERAELLPQPGPEALRLDGDLREIADFFGDLRLVAKVGDQHDVARADEQQRARAGEAGEISDVRAGS